MNLLAIDPGPTESAWVLFDTATGHPIRWATDTNPSLRAQIRTHHDEIWTRDMLAVEMIASYGMPVGREVFETCVWVGRFIEAWNAPHQLVYRQDVKLHLTHDTRAKDSNIRQALIDRYGPGKDRAIGKKASPGPLYGLTGDCWAALGVAVTAADTMTEDSGDGPAAA